MLPADPGDRPSTPVTDIVPLQAMAHGGKIIRPGAVAWGGTGNTARQVSCEAIERALAAAAAGPAGLPGLLAELAAARLWVPLPPARRAFTDGTAVRLPLVSLQGTDFVPCFTSVLRLTAWAGEAGWPERRAGDARAVPHIVVPAAGLAGRLPPGVGLALNPDGDPGLPVYPECLPQLAVLAASGRADPRVVDAWTACNSRRLSADTSLFTGQRRGPVRPVPPRRRGQRNEVSRSGAGVLVVGKGSAALAGCVVQAGQEIVTAGHVRGVDRADAVLGLSD